MDYEQHAIYSFRDIANVQIGSKIANLLNKKSVYLGVRSKIHRFYFFLFIIVFIYTSSRSEASSNRR